MAQSRWWSRRSFTVGLGVAATVAAVVDGHRAVPHRQVVARIQRRSGQLALLPVETDQQVQRESARRWRGRIRSATPASIRSPSAA